MLTLLNNAQRECQKQLINAGENFYVKRVSTTTVANTEMYVLPTDFLKLHKLELLLSGTTPNENRALLIPMTLIEIEGVSQTTGTPVAYALKKNCMILRPIPDQALTMYMHYSPLVTDMSADADIPDVPTQYQEYLAILAAIDGFIKDDRDPSNIILKKQMYLDMMKQDTEDRTVDAPRMIRMLDDADCGWLY